MRMSDFKYLKFMSISILLAGLVVLADDQENSRTWGDSTIAIRQNLEGRMKRETEDGNDRFVHK